MAIDEHVNTSEFIITYNCATTRAIFIKQPFYVSSMIKQDLLENNLNSQKETYNDMLLKPLKLSK